MHTSPLRAVGGSISVTPPRQMLRTLGLAAAALVAVTLEDRRLVLSPTRPRYTLPDQLAGRTWAYWAYASASRTTSGCLRAMRMSACAAPEGDLRPCSHS